MNFVAVLTPAGRAAIATLAVQGPDAWAIVRSLLVRAGGKETPAEPGLGDVWVGKLGAGQVAEEVVVGITQLTPVPRVEVHCHGGSEVVRMLVNLFEDRGVREVSWQELETSPWQASVWEALSQAPTQRTAAILLDQAQGAWTSLLERIVEHLAHNEAEAARALARPAL